MFQAAADNDSALNPPKMPSGLRGQWSLVTMPDTTATDPGADNSTTYATRLLTGVIRS